MKFSFLDKSQFSTYRTDLFTILHSNMSLIAPTGNEYSEDFDLWNKAVNSGLKADTRHIILIHQHDELVGFFQYYTSGDLFMMEEVQILAEYQGRGRIFENLFTFVLDKLPEGIRYVEAYSDKNNLKSQGILKHLGLSCIGENAPGTSYQFRGDFSSLRLWHESLLRVT